MYLESEGTPYLYVSDSSTDDCDKIYSGSSYSGDNCNLKNHGGAQVHICR